MSKKESNPFGPPHGVEPVSQTVEIEGIGPMEVNVYKATFGKDSVFKGSLPDANKWITQQKQAWSKVNGPIIDIARIRNSVSQTHRRLSVVVDKGADKLSPEALDALKNAVEWLGESIPLLPEPPRMRKRSGRS